MRHAREDYERFQDPAGLIPDDEPVFLIRGQDQIGATVVQVYALFAELAGADPDLVQRCRDHADRMANWPRHKLPDLADSEPAGQEALMTDVRHQLRLFQSCNPHDFTSVAVLEFVKEYPDHLNVFFSMNFFSNSIDGAREQAERWLAEPSNISAVSALADSEPAGRAARSQLRGSEVK